VGIDVCLLTPLIPGARERLLLPQQLRRQCQQSLSFLQNNHHYFYKITSFKSGWFVVLAVMGRRKAV